MALLLTASMLGDGKDRELADDVAARTILGIASGIRSGRSLSEVLESRVSDDPDTLAAIRVAQQMRVAQSHRQNWKPSKRATIRPTTDEVAKEVAILGLSLVADAEAMAMAKDVADPRARGASSPRRRSGHPLQVYESGSMA